MTSITVDILGFLSKTFPFNVLEAEVLEKLLITKHSYCVDT